MAFCAVTVSLDHLRKALCLDVHSFFIAILIDWTNNYVEEDVIATVDVAVDVELGAIVVTSEIVVIDLDVAVAVAVT